MNINVFPPPPLRVVSAMAYWNSPQGKRDEEFVSPFRITTPDGKKKYVTLEPDAVSIGP